MKIEIWSDIMCPFCYIGKRHLEQALAAFPQTEFTIEWKSFQLDPTITPQPEKDVYTYLAERKGMTVEQSREMHQHVVERAAAVGLDYRFDKAVIANSYKAHRLLQLAKTMGQDQALEELFFRAYFTEGADLNQEETLVGLAQQVGISSELAEKALSNSQFANAVAHDIQEAQAIGVQGVPFFVFDRQYAISGAQPVGAFIETIEAVLKG